MFSSILDIEKALPFVASPRGSYARHCRDGRGLRSFSSLLKRCNSPNTGEVNSSLKFSGEPGNDGKGMELWFFAHLSVPKIKLPNLLSTAHRYIDTTEPLVVRPTFDVQLHYGVRVQQSSDFSAQTTHVISSSTKDTVHCI